MTNRTTARWPHADVLVEYLRDYARAQERVGRIAYGHTVSKLAKQADGGFSLTVASVTGSRPLACRFVVVASGLAKPNHPKDIPGLDLTINYADLPSESSSFEGRTVAVLGAGNAGFEVANDMAPYVNYVHVFSGRGMQLENEMMSFESRYVGNVRAINAALLDSYLLKSLDGGLSATLPARLLHIFPCGLRQEQRCIFPRHFDDGQFVKIGTYSKDDAEAVAYVASISANHKIEDRVLWGPSIVHVDLKQQYHEERTNYL